MRGRIAPVGWSVALHAALAGLLYLGITLPTQEPEHVPMPINAVVVDDAVLQAAGQQRRQDDRAAVEERRRLEAEREAERLEQERLEAERLEQAEEQQRIEEQERIEEQQRLEAQQEAERQARAEAEAKQKAETEAKRKAEQEARAKAESDRRAAREAELREQREADLRAQLAAEEARTSAGFQSLKASYVAAIQAHVERRWYEPPGGTEGLVCRVFVTQIPGGEVTGMRFGSCNAGGAVRQSIETAVRNSSPLPPPPQPDVFEREVELIFTPKETRR
jgi:colicin import membrane protein